MGPCVSVKVINRPWFVWTLHLVCPQLSSIATQTKPPPLGDQRGRVPCVQTPSSNTQWLGSHDLQDWAKQHNIEWRFHFSVTYKRRSWEKGEMKHQSSRWEEVLLGLLLQQSRQAKGWRVAERGLHLLQLPHTAVVTTKPLGTFLFIFLNS